MSRLLLDPESKRTIAVLVFITLFSVIGIAYSAIVAPTKETKECTLEYAQVDGGRACEVQEEQATDEYFQHLENLAH